MDLDNEWTAEERKAEFELCKAVEQGVAVAIHQALTEGYLLEGQHEGRTVEIVGLYGPQVTVGRYAGPERFPALKERVEYSVLLRDVTDCAVVGLCE
jgi:hypothetical protein